MPPLGRQFKWVWDVDFAHSKDTLKQGEVHAGTHRVSTLGHGETDSGLAAEQMVAATGHEPTGKRLVDFPYDA